MNAIPVVDLSKIKYVDNESIVDSPEWQEAAEKIRDGLGGIGFLYLVNHGVPEETIANAFAESKRFFDLPLEVKLKYKKDTSVSETGTFDIEKVKGYTPLGGEKFQGNASYEIRETYGWLNKTICMASTIDTSKLHDSIAELESECKVLYKKLLTLLALSLNLDCS